MKLIIVRNGIAETLEVTSWAVPATEEYAVASSSDANKIYETLGNDKRTDMGDRILLLALEQDIARKSSHNRSK